MSTRRTVPLRYCVAARRSELSIRSLYSLPSDVSVELFSSGDCFDQEDTTSVVVDQHHARTLGILIDGARIRHELG